MDRGAPRGSRDTRRHWLRLSASAILAVACGGRTSGPPSPSRDACIDSIGQFFESGARTLCDCPERQSGSMECQAGTWTPCACGTSSSSPVASSVSPTPTTCGNGRVEDGEECDGGRLRGESCATVTMGARPVGMLACSAACTFDTSGCGGQLSQMGGGGVSVGGTFGAGAATSGGGFAGFPSGGVAGGAVTTGGLAGYVDAGSPFDATPGNTPAGDAATD